MKKTLVAMSLVGMFLGGCSSTSASYDDLKGTGNKLASTDYQVSSMPSVERVRLTVDSTFRAAKPIYENYIEALLAEKDLNNFFNALNQLETEEEKQALYDSLTPEQKQKVDNTVNSKQMKDLVKSLGRYALEIAAISKTFAQIDTTSLLTQVDFSKLMTEKDNISYTSDQLMYLSDTVSSAYKNYQVMQALTSSI